MFKAPTEGLIVKATGSLRDVLAVIDSVEAKIALVTDESGALHGVATDGDARRALLAGCTLDAPAASIANRDPVTLRESASIGEIKALMRAKTLRHVPIVDSVGRPVTLWMRGAIAGARGGDTPVLLMAGGEGLRLRPLTSDTPKPLLPLGGRPILHRLIERLSEDGFTRFFISVNYLGHMIEEYFGDGSDFGVSIEYVREPEKLGTAGALSLLPRHAFDHCLVMNGDILTDADLNELLAVHAASNAAATVCVREHRTSLPFGVVSFEGAEFRAIVEKPTMAHFVNAGVYCFSASAVASVEEGAPIDMPDLFMRLKRAGEPCGVHPISGSRWIDIGTPEELSRARALVGETEQADGSPRKHSHGYAGSAA